MEYLYDNHKITIDEIEKLYFKNLLSGKNRTAC